jgi:hypothetical protein
MMFARGTSFRRPPRTWSAHTAAVVAKLEIDLSGRTPG